MAGRQAVKDVNAALTGYQRSLEDLTFNSKPLIDDLTRAAEQLEPKGDEVVEIIRRRIMKVRPEWKLPSLYLLDSIMKNLKGSYLEHVGQVIVAVFCHCFEVLTEPDPRKMLYKLRITWTPYLSKHKLATLDKHVRALDPKWPVIALDSDSPTAIFINPKFMVEGQEKSQNKEKTGSIEQRRKAVLQQTINQRQEQERVMGLGTKEKDSASNAETSKVSLNPTGQQQASRARSTSPRPPNVSGTRSHRSASPPCSSRATTDQITTATPPPAKRVKMEDEGKDTTAAEIKEAHLQLDDIPPELLPIHQKKMCERIERQINAGNLTPEHRTTLVNQLNQLYELQKHKLDCAPSLQFSSSSKSYPPPPTNQPVYGVERQPRDFSSHPTPPLPCGHLESRSHPRARAPAQFGPRYQSFGRGGHVTANHTQSERKAHSQVPLPVGDLLQKLKEEGLIGGETKLSSVKSNEPGTHPMKVPNLALTPATLKQRYSSVIALLHSGVPCSSCGLRFSNSSGEQYESHLNWHYRINRQEKEDAMTSRNWFMHPDDWFKYEELVDDLGDMKLQQQEVSELELTSVTLDVKPKSESCSVEASDVNEVCVVCNEPFEQFWEEVEESWHLRDALRIDGGKLCHTFCYKDMELN